MREINKTKTNITKSNITKTTELTLEEAAAMEKERFSFVEFKRECFEIMRNERAIDEEYIALVDRAIEYLWFKNGADYEGHKYTQEGVRRLLIDKTTVDILCASVQFLEHSKEPIRSPVPYLAKCILGGLVNGFLEYKKPQDEAQNAFSSVGQSEASGNDGSTFEVNDFFAQALKNTYGFDF